MNLADVNKVLSNDTRLNILEWLKDPEKHFPPHNEIKHFDDGVCVLYITEKAEMSASTISHYLSMLQNVGFVIPTRLGKWTYYKRDEKVIGQYIHQLTQNLK